MTRFLVFVIFLLGTSNQGFGKHIGRVQDYKERSLSKTHREVGNGDVTTTIDPCITVEAKAKRARNETELTKEILESYLKKCKTVKTPTQLEKREKVIQKILTKLNHTTNIKASSARPGQVVSRHVAAVLRDIAFEIARQEQCVEIRNKDMHLLRKLEKRMNKHEAEFGTPKQLASTRMVLNNILKFMESNSIAICDKQKTTTARVKTKSTVNKHNSASSMTPSHGAGNIPSPTIIKRTKSTQPIALTTSVKLSKRKSNEKLLETTASNHQSTKTTTSKHKSTASPSKPSSPTAKHKTSVTERPSNSTMIKSANNHASLTTHVKPSIASTTKKPSTSTTVKHKLTTRPSKGFPSTTKTRAIEHPSSTSTRRPRSSHAAALSPSVNPSPNEKLSKSAKVKSSKASIMSSSNTTTKHKTPVEPPTVSSTTVKHQTSPIKHPPFTIDKKSTLQTAASPINASKKHTNRKSTTTADELIVTTERSRTTSASHRKTSHSVSPTTRKQFTAPHLPDEWEKFADLMKADYPDFFPALLDKTILNLKSYYNENHIKHVPFYRMAQSIVDQFKTLDKLLSTHVLKNIL